MLQKKTADQLPLERRILTAVWEMLKDFYDITIDSDDWLAVLDRMEMIAALAPDGPAAGFARAQALAIQTYLEDLSRERA